MVQHCTFVHSDTNEAVNNVAFDLKIAVVLPIARAFQYNLILILSPYTTN